MFLKVISNPLYKRYFYAYILIISGFVIIILSLSNILIPEFNYYFNKLLGTKYTFVFNLQLKGEDKITLSKPYLFKNFIKRNIYLNPVDKNFSIIIEKLGVNAPVIKNVSVTNEREYFNALKKGVAHAKGIPGKPGNTYLFAHSSLEFWKMGPYATVFNQLRKLKTGDSIYIVYKNNYFKYIVKEKFIVSGFNTSPFLQEYKKESVLTLQTCDPPGTTLNRLIIRAYLKN